MDSITVIIPTSPIPSHPETRVIDETIASVRTHLPDSEIILMIDGVREEQDGFTANFREYTRRILWKASHEWDATPLLFQEHTHQAGMTRRALQLVKTPLVLFVEHDTPLTPDRPIPFEKLSQDILSGKANMIRFHHEALVLEVHKHLMIGEPEGDIWATYQYSQRPHLASTEWYKQLLNKIPPLAKTMIEDAVYGKLEVDYRERGKAGWDSWRTYLYYPEGDIKRSYTTDGREGEPKYESTFGL